MKGRGRSARLAAAASPRQSASASTRASFSSAAASVAEPEPGPEKTGSGSPEAGEPAHPAVGGQNSLQPRPESGAAVPTTLARGDELDSLPLDETEYTDAVDNEFVRGRMENVVRVATGNDINVTFGDGFHTDLSGGVQLDPNDPSKDAEPEDRIVMMQGGLEHEICHELYYDKRAFEDLKSQLEADPSRRPVAFINNILADGHDEWRHKLARPEAYGLIEAHDALFVAHNGSGRWSFDPDKGDTWTQVTGAMLYRGLPYYRVPEEKLSQEALEAYREVSPNVDAAIKGTSHDCLEQANRIHDKLKSRGLIPQSPQEDHLGGGAGPGSGGSPGMDSSGGSSGGGTSGSEASNSGDSNAGSTESSTEGSSGPGEPEDAALTGEGLAAYEGSVGSHEAGGKEGTQGGESTEASAGGTESSAGSGSPASGSGDSASSESASDGAGSSGSSTSSTSAGASDFAADPGAGQAELESRRRQAASLADTASKKRPQSSHRNDPAEQVSRPPDALAEFRERWQNNRRLAHEFASRIKEVKTETPAPKKRQSSGRLDRGRKRALASGDENVFVKRGRERAVDMSVELLLDVSGSMSASISGLKDSSSVISRGLDEAKIEHEVRGFSDTSNQPLYRAFGEKADWKLGAMRAGGMTDMGGGLAKLREGFAARSEKQKLALVLADGQPASDDAVREQLAQARREGVTPVGIFLREKPDPSMLPDHFTERQRKRWVEDRKQELSQGEAKMRELFGGNVAVLDDVGQLPKVAGKRIVDLMRRQR